MVVQLVEVVEHQPQRLVEAAEVLEQALDEVARVELATRGERSDHVRSRAGGAERADHGQPEPLRIALPPTDGDPCHPVLDVRFGHPGSQQRRLAAARRSGYERDARAGGERLEQCGARDDPVPLARAGSSDGCVPLCHAAETFS